MSKVIINILLQYVLNSIPNRMNDNHHPKSLFLQKTYVYFKFQHEIYRLLKASFPQFEQELHLLPLQACLSGSQAHHLQTTGNVVPMAGERISRWDKDMRSRQLAMMTTLFQFFVVVVKKHYKEEHKAVRKELEWSLAFFPLKFLLSFPTYCYF